MRVILASKSPRRKEILAGLGVPFEILSADADESCAITDPALLVQELALRKGRATRALLQARGEWDASTLIIAADTVVAAKGEILGKPHDAADACRMLSMLADSTHHVISGVSLLMGERELAAFERTAVCFAPMTAQEIEQYVQTGEPNDKAGAYAIQGLASMYIKGIEGCYFNVVGLPVHRLELLLRELIGAGLSSLAN